MSNSSLVSYTKISPNSTSPRNHAIDVITPHCVVGQCSVETLGDIFAKASRQASCQYGIGYDGRIGLFCDEADRSWCTSSSSNDHRAITIECASDTFYPYRMNDCVIESLIDLLTDICQRNGIAELLWEADSDLLGQVDRQNITAHRWFANKSCPGDYLYNKYPEIVAEVNKRLSKEEDDTMTGEEIYKALTKYLEEQPTSDYAKEASKKGIESGMFADGDKDGLVDNPRGILTREQLAVVLNRAGILDK